MAEHLYTFSNISISICISHIAAFLHLIGLNKQNFQNGVRAMVFNVTFNNISVISWQSSFIGGGNREYLEKCIIFERNYVVILRFCISKMSCLFIHEKKKMNQNECYPSYNKNKFWSYDNEHTVCLSCNIWNFLNQRHIQWKSGLLRQLTS